jgi:hypothetical protein
MPEIGEWGLEEHPEEEEVVEERVICLKCVVPQTEGRKEKRLHGMVPLRNTGPRE